jgi:hypothetical protein
MTSFDSDMERVEFWASKAVGRAIYRPVLDRIRITHREMEMALRAYKAIFTAWEGRDEITLSDEALRQWKSIADEVLKINDAPTQKGDA